MKERIAIAKEKAGRDGDIENKTASKSRKCRKVAEAFTELYENDDTAILDAGKYGFVKLQYYNINNGFDCVTTYTDSSELFNSLWEDWLYINLLEQNRNTRNGKYGI